MKENLFFNVVTNANDRAVIEINGTIGSWDWDKDNGWHEVNSGSDIRRQLDELGDVKEVDVLITSLGGDVDYALQIHDALKDHPAKVTTIINGFCASAATIIALAGNVRKISKNALYLIHKCSSSAWGNEHDLESELESQKTVNKVLYDMYKSVCKKEEQDLHDLFNADNGHGKWITAQEVVDFGFCDEIYNDETSSAKVAMVDSSLLLKLGYPQIPTQSEIQEEKLMNRIIEKMRDIFAPKVNQIINQNQEPMKKFLTVFACLGALLAFKDDQEYDDKTGHTLTNEELGKVEAELAAYEQLKQDHQALTSERDQLKNEKDALTRERDDFKSKWENAPAPVQTPAGNDPVENVKLDEEYYDKIEKELSCM